MAVSVTNRGQVALAPLRATEQGGVIPMVLESEEAQGMLLRKTTVM